ncbi:MAG: VOC family protein [Candidatus Bipolaricaulota bacterium]|nr:VOC family protein [Candidatus Bipolaricaulota bacterium]
MSNAGVFRGLDTVLLRVRDVRLAKTWYQEKLDFPDPYFDPAERLAVFGLGGTTSLTLWELKPGETLCPEDDHAKTLPIFSVVNARQTWHLLRDRGVAVGEVVESGGVTYFTFKDLDGNLLEACQVH